ncbi:carbohydrate esterase family 4 protein [Trichoderma asperelloides]|nr:carbohydrate esterase family 4 protein [Trichoderma asperelloides]
MKLTAAVTAVIAFISSEAVHAAPGKSDSAFGHILESRDKHCGSGIGSCDEGECCSESGLCGTSTEYCAGSQCQLDYSDSCDTHPGHVALTFDDGPYDYTDKLLDILEEHNVKATFFIAGNNRGKGRIDDESTDWPPIIRRMHDAGHQLASHTWTHRNLNEVSKGVRETEMIYNEMAFRNLLGVIPTYMRPPFLECSAKSGCIDTMDKLGYHIISTNLDTKDYENDDASLIQVSKNRFSSMQMTDETDHDYIVLAHDVHYQTVVNLTEYMIEVSKSRGYKLVTVGECLGDPSQNWYRSAPSKRDTDSIVGPGDDAKGDDEPAISEDQRCGSKFGTTCKGSIYGKCCSYYGYCGSSMKHCGTGCDSRHGDCAVQMRPRTNLAIFNTTNGLCGDQFSATCKNYENKTCCSKFGFCGNSSAHCAVGCQKSYGNCWKAIKDSE